jgi:hypothetical protein
MEDIDLELSEFMDRLHMRDLLDEENHWTDDLFDYETHPLDPDIYEADDGRYASESYMEEYY